MAANQGTDLQPGRQVRLPAPAGAGRLLTREGFIRSLYHLLRQLGLRLQVEGSSQADATADGARWQVRPGGDEDSEEIPEAGGFDPGPDANCLCALGAVLEAKRTRLCGYASCCGDPVPNGELPPTEAAALTITTQHCTLWDYTGGELVTSSCTRTIEVDKDSGGSGTVAGPCAAGLPSCGEWVTTETGCNDLPECGEVPPPPGYACYSVNGSELLRGKLCAYADLPTTALAAAEPEIDTEWTAAAVTDMLGASSYLDALGAAAETSWQIRRRGQRIPAHLILTITEVDEADTVTEIEEIITLPAGTSEGVYTLALPAGIGSRSITGLEIVYGRLPA